MKQILFVIIAVTGMLFAGNQVMSLDDVRQSENSIEVQPKETRTAVFAGGCFWCTESDFEKIDGVVQAISGYTGGHVDHPTYKQVSAGGTGHVEAVKVIYDPAKIQYEGLLEVLWRSINPTDPGGQFVDRGPQYRSAIFYANERQRQLAKTSRDKLGAAGIFDEPIATEILPLKNFYEAEEYHQDYYKKNPIRYKWYRSGSGRDLFLKGIWADRPVELKESGMESNAKKMENDHRREPSVQDRDYNKPSDAVLQIRLTPLQYNVTQKNATERPFQNAFWNHHEVGIYVDIVSGEPLFSSRDKFNSGTGWPSFTRPLEPVNIVKKSDRSLFMVRTEVRSKHAESHLGHLFNDGPQPTGLRYCINSAALRFISEENLEKEGYGKYAGSF